MEEINITAEPTVPTKNKYVIGIAVTHIYGLELEAENSDLAVLKMDNWLRGNLPVSELRPEIRTSDLNVLGVGVIEAGGKLVDAPHINDETRAELELRGALPDAGCVHLFPAPPVGVAPAAGLH